MTDEEIDQVIAATSRPSGGRWTVPFRRFGRWAATTRIGRWAAGKTARWQTILAILALASGYPFVIASIGATNERQVNQQIYVAKVVSYSQAVAAHELCLDGVTRSDDNRAQWEQLADIIAALDTGSGRALAFADQIRNGPLLAAAPRVAADCPDPGPAPVEPSP